MMPTPCRHSAGQAALDTPIMDAIESKTRPTAQLSRLIGLVVPQPDDLSKTALQAAGALCDFDAGCVLRTKCLAAAAAVASGSRKVGDKVTSVLQCASCLHLKGHDSFGKGHWR